MFVHKAKYILFNKFANYYIFGTDYFTLKINHLHKYRHKKTPKDIECFFERYYTPYYKNTLIPIANDEKFNRLSELAFIPKPEYLVIEPSPLLSKFVYLVDI